MKVLVLLAKGFETMEFSVFIDVMGWARVHFGCDVETVTCGLGKQVMSTFLVPVIVDKTLDGIDADDYAALAIPGGFEQFGFYEEAYDERVLDLIRTFEARGKPIATVCVAALALGKSGILANRKATTYHLMGGHRQRRLAAFGVNVVNEPVVVDRDVITSYCPETAPYVAFKLLERLTSKAQADTVRAAMGFPVEENLADSFSPPPAAHPGDGRFRAPVSPPCASDERT